MNNLEIVLSKYKGTRDRFLIITKYEASIASLFPNSYTIKLKLLIILSCINLQEKWQGEGTEERKCQNSIRERKCKSSGSQKEKESVTAGGEKVTGITL